MIGLIFNLVVDRDILNIKKCNENRFFFVLMVLISQLSPPSPSAAFSFFPLNKKKQENVCLVIHMKAILHRFIMKQQHVVLQGSYRLLLWKVFKSHYFSVGDLFSARSYEGGVLSSWQPSLPPTPSWKWVSTQRGRLFVPWLTRSADLWRCMQMCWCLSS